MNRNFFLLTTAMFLMQHSFAGAPFAQWNDSVLTLNNGIVQRTIKLPAAAGDFFTTSYKPVAGDFQFFKNTNPEFAFVFNGISYSGNSAWTLVGNKTITDANGGNGAAVTVVSRDKKVQLTISYLLYPNSAAIRKTIGLKNLSNREAALESVDIEKFSVTDYWVPTFSLIFSDYGRRRSIGPYEGNAQDALLIVHYPERKQGIVIGNEASGVVKRTSVFWNNQEICTGLTHKNNAYPFRKWVKPGDSFETPPVFTMVYNQYKDVNGVLSGAVPDFIRNHMGIRLSQLRVKPTFVYNTWVPFKKDINEKLIIELAKAAAAAGMKEFIIDDGWQDNYGDWGIDKIKFPHGLKPVFDSIKSLGMKPGLWVSVGSASSVSKVYSAHPGWFVKDRQGKFANLQLAGNSMDVRSACFGTGWKEYIKKILMQLAVDYGLEYLKLDFAVVTSPYRFAKDESGCYATYHRGHKDHNESLFTNYEQVWKLFDELHAAKPDLFIDCTFEAMGGLQLIDYAMLKHAEGNWLSNFGGADDKVDLRIRNMAWWRSPAMPATALVIGNPEMQDTAWSLHIKSLAGALPIMLGDPRKLSATDFKKYRGYADWLQAMDSLYGIMSFRQDLPGFGEPAEGAWDGFQRINTETKEGGIAGVFRHGAVEARRIVTIQFLDPGKLYEVKEMNGHVVTLQSGKELAEMGFEVVLGRLYDGELFEIRAK